MLVAVVVEMVVVAVVVVNIDSQSIEKINRSCLKNGNYFITDSLSCSGNYMFIPFSLSVIFAVALITLEETASQGDLHLILIIQLSRLKEFSRVQENSILTHPRIERGTF